MYSARAALRGLEHAGVQLVSTEEEACEKPHSPLWEGWDLNTLGPRPVWLWLPSELLAPQVGGPLCPSLSAQNPPPQLSLPSWGGGIAHSLSLLPAWSSRDNVHSKDSRVPPPPAPDSYISGRPRGWVVAGQLLRGARPSVLRHTPPFSSISEVFPGEPARRRITLLRSCQ